MAPRLIHNRPGAGRLRECLVQVRYVAAEDGNYALNLDVDYEDCRGNAIPGLSDSSWTLIEMKGQHVNTSTSAMVTTIGLRGAGLIFGVLLSGRTRPAGANPRYVTFRVVPSSL